MGYYGYDWRECRLYNLQKVPAGGIDRIFALLYPRTLILRQCGDSTA